MPRQEQGQGKKRKKNYYVQFQKKQRNNTLEPGTRGFLITCNNDERRCIREAYNMLNEFAGAAQDVKEDRPKSEEEERSVEVELREELDALREAESSQGAGRTFQQVYTGIQSCLFVQSKLDPCPILLRILEDIVSKGQQRTLATQRMFPVLATCKAHLDSLRKALKEVLDQIMREKEVYQTDSAQLQYAVLFRARHNSSISKDEVVTTVIDMVRSQGVAWQPEPRNPDCAISVDVLSGICCISVLPRYGRYRRYNLIELGKEGPAGLEEEQKKGTGNGHGATGVEKGDDSSRLTNTGDVQDIVKSSDSEGQTNESVGERKLEASETS